MKRRDLLGQADNGGEFIGRENPDDPERRRGFPTAWGDSQSVRIPPAAPPYQSDVGTVHRLVEDEFFDLEVFPSRGDFLAQATTYQLYFNLVRPNSHKDYRSPWQIIARLARRSNSACFLRSFWITTSTTTGVTIYLSIPTCESTAQHLAELFPRFGCRRIPPVTGNAG